MQSYICCTCAAHFNETKHPPETCPICEDDRQYVGRGGQKWSTSDELIDQGYKIQMTEVEEGVWGFQVEPKLGIGQQAYLIQTPQGNVLWDCVGLLHPGIVEEVEAMGGLKAIAISHPHFNGACAEWSAPFGCQVFIHEADRKWTTRNTFMTTYWVGDSKELWPGLQLLRLGGHFPGSSVLLWKKARDGHGVVFAGDTVFPVAHTGWVSFMYSFPNLLPLPAAEVARIARTLGQHSFDRLYGPFPESRVLGGADRAVQVSAERYCGILEGSAQIAYT